MKTFAYISVSMKAAYLKLWVINDVENYFICVW